MTKDTDDTYCYSFKSDIPTPEEHKKALNKVLARAECARLKRDRMAAKVFNEAWAKLFR